MATISQRKKQQQFGLKLLIVAIIVAIVFTAWYLSEKNAKNWMMQTGTNKLAQIPADDLKDMKDVYLKAAADIMNNGYDNVLLADNFNFKTSLKRNDLSVITDAKSFWRAFPENYGQIDAGSVRYDIAGNQVKIVFSSTKNEQKFYFWRILSFNNYDKPGRTKLEPALLEEYWIERSAAEMEAGNNLLKVGSNLNQMSMLGKVHVSAVVDGQVTRLDLLKEIQYNWTMIMFFQGAFTSHCPVDCLNLLENVDKFNQLNIKLYAVGADLPTAQLAWIKSYFGSLPFPLITDTDLSFSSLFGMADYANWAPFKGVVIIDNKGVVRYIATQDQQLARDFDQYLTIIKMLQIPELRQPGE